MKVVGYVECKDKQGNTYFKGEDGSICLPNPDKNDRRPSQWIHIGKVEEDKSQQASLGDFK